MASSSEMQCISKYKILRPGGDCFFEIIRIIEWLDQKKSKHHKCLLIKYSFRLTRNFHFLFYTKYTDKNFLKHIAAFSVLTEVESLFFFLAVNAKSHCFLKDF